MKIDVGTTTKQLEELLNTGEFAILAVLIDELHLRTLGPSDTNAARIASVIADSKHNVDDLMKREDIGSLDWEREFFRISDPSVFRTTVLWALHDGDEENRSVIGNEEHFGKRAPLIFKWLQDGVKKVRKNLKIDQWAPGE